MAQETEYRLRKIQFTKALRGYSCEEVDTYLAYVNDRYAALGKECSELKKKMAVMAAGQNEFREDALREKEKIAAEADAMVRERQNAANKLMDDAKRKAAGLLADAEAAAAGILKRAEEEAGELRAKRQEEDEAAIRNAGRMLAERNNAADRLVEEIDSFREEIFAMYARHIEELERLAQRTDAFYQTKEELTEGMTDGTEPDADGMELSDAAEDIGTEEELYMPVETAEADLSEDTAEEAGEAEEWTEPDEEDENDDDLLRIDWKKHRASRETAEAEQEAAKTLWEIADEAAAQDSWETEDAPADVLDSLEEELAAVPAREEDNLSDAFASLEDVYEDYDAGEAEEDDGEFDLLTEEDDDEDDEDEDDAPAEDETGEDNFLSDIASEYIKPSRSQTAKAAAEPQKQPAQNAGKAVRKKESGDLDELFYEDAKNVSLTGEFDIIFNSKKSAANVTEISRQPLVEATKPEKPKKHSTK